MRTEDHGEQGLDAKNVNPGDIGLKRGRPAGLADDRL